ncbi:MAG: hypothetical protein MHM6MM_006423 [Cercozoa sp. M6MM]
MAQESAPVPEIMETARAIEERPMREIARLQDHHRTANAILALQNSAPIEQVNRLLLLLHVQLCKLPLVQRATMYEHSACGKREMMRLVPFLPPKTIVETLQTAEERVNRLLKEHGQPEPPDRLVVLLARMQALRHAARHTDAAKLHPGLARIAFASACHPYSASRTPSPVRQEDALLALSSFSSNSSASASSSHTASKRLATPVAANSTPAQEQAAVQQVPPDALDSPLHEPAAPAASDTQTLAAASDLKSHCHRRPRRARQVQQHRDTPLLPRKRRRKTR